MFMKLLTPSKIHRATTLRGDPRSSMYIPPNFQQVGEWKLLSFKLNANESRESRFPYRPGAISSRKLCPMSLTFQPHWAFSDI